MLDQLIKLVQENAGDAIVKNPAIPDQQNNAAIRDVAENIFEGLKSQASQGNLQQIAGMFGNGGSTSLVNNPVISQIISNAAGSLSNKFGVSPQIAQQIVSSLIPTVMNRFVRKTNDPNDNDFNLQDVLSQFGGSNAVSDILNKMGGSSGGLGGMLGGFFGN